MKNSMIVLALLAIAGIGSAFRNPGDTTELYPEVSKYFSSLKKKFNSITTKRERELNRLSQVIEKKKSKSMPCSVVFVSSDNSGSDQLAQVILHAAAVYYKISGVTFYSAGSSSSNLDGRIAAALGKFGFKATVGEKTEVKFSDANAIQLFSKKTDDSSLPKSEFYSVLVCAENTCTAPSNSEYTIKLPLKDLSQIKDEQEFQKEFEKIAVELSSVMYTLKQIGK